MMVKENDPVFIPLKSSAMDKAAYDEKKRELTIHFTDGDLRTYKKVPKAIAVGFFNAGSHGVFFNAVIRNKFDHN